MQASFPLTARLQEVEEGEQGLLSSRLVGWVVRNWRTSCLVHVRLIECDGRWVIGMHQDKGRAAFQLCGDKSLSRRCKIWVADEREPLLDNVLCCRSYVCVCRELQSAPHHSLIA